MIFQTIPKTAAINVDIDNYDYRNMPVTEENVFIYICGYLLRRVFVKHYCDVCALLTQKDCDVELLNLYSYFKAYQSTDKDNFGSLYVPSTLFISYIKQLHIKFYENVSNFIAKPNVKNFVGVLSTVEFLHTCPNFPQNYLIKLFVRVRIYYILKFIHRRFRNPNEHNRKISILSHI